MNASAQTMTKKHELPDLEKMYTEAEQCDSEIFSEMRSNLLLISGEHYNKRQSSFFRRIRDSKELNEQQKLRLTKNHIQNITKTYVNNIISQAPGVGFEPKNSKELKDQKSAELHHSVWQDACDRYGIQTELVDEWCDDFVGLGEVATKIFFDPMGGKLKGYAQAVDEMGSPVANEYGQPQPDMEQPMYTGEFVFEELQGFNLLRSPEAKAMKKSPWNIVRKMSAIDYLIARFPDKEQFIKASEDRTMMVFDGAKGGYRKASGEVMVKEIYFRPCPLYPQGFFFMWTKEGILAEGDLPGGIYPIIFQPFEKIQTTPRGRSPVKTMRPYQAEINRSASKMAEHQITLGDDKLLIQNGTKISSGVALPGVRSINYNGAQPGILAGRDGSQYLNYMQVQTLEMYSVMNVKELAEDAPTGQMDPYALLFRSASQKKKFNRYVRKFEKFLMDVAKVYIQLAKIHLSPEDVIYAVGKSEQINISEFKNTTDICYEVKVIAQTDDIETKLGKQLVINHALQYIGNKLEKDDIGKLMRAGPYSNDESSFDDFTLDYDIATNIVLELDRGGQPQIQPFDNNPYIIKKLTKRMREPDFRFLDPQIQGNYQQLVMMYEQSETQRLAAIKDAESELIPTDGYLVVCDLYVPDPNNPTKTMRARVPYTSLTWLLKRLEAQGQGTEELDQMNQGAVAQMASMLFRNNGAGGANGMAQPAPAMNT